jgi:hypothetical protein
VRLSVVIRRWASPKRAEAGRSEGKRSVERPWSPAAKRKIEGRWEGQVEYRVPGHPNGPFPRTRDTKRDRGEKRRRHTLAAPPVTLRLQCPPPPPIGQWDVYSPPPSRLPVPLIPSLPRPPRPRSRSTSSPLSPSCLGPQVLLHVYVLLACCSVLCVCAALVSWF